MHEDLSREFSLAGKAAVVTGAASGIGQETARTLAQAGARVVLADLDEARLAETEKQIAAVGGQSLARRVDVSDRDAVEALADAAVVAFGGLDVWVSAAGMLINGPILEMTAAQVARITAVNQMGVYWGVAAAGRVMRDQGRGGSIVSISSSGADSSPPGVSAYAMTKAAVNALTRGAAREFGAFGVRVNSVSPGWIETPMVSYRFKDADGRFDPQKHEAAVKMMAQASPLGLTGLPRDIALAVLYLAADASRFVTGQVIRPNGGASMP